MNSVPALRDLVRLTLTDPAEAARQILAQYPGREGLWSAFLLAVVLNTIMYLLSDMTLPPPPPEMVMFDMPVAVYFGFLTAGLLVTGLALYRVGRAFGGSGSFADVMILLVWLQLLRALALVVVLVLALTVPLLSALATLATGLYGLYIMLHFIDQAHHLDSIGRAGSVLIASVLAVALGVFVLLQLVGTTI